ncbi:methyltransferase [Candidatus Poribacteria bacterium]|nr:methyltransferase [Candidatus Poribacteria bacterium]
MTDYKSFLKPGERIDLFSGLKVIQKIDGPRFSLDAVMLSQFTRVKKDDLVMELGTGNGIVALLLARDTRSQQVTGIEIQEELADLARRNVRLNGLDDKIRILTEDLRLVEKNHQPGQFDLIVSNPPYRRLGDGRLNPNPLKAISRHEIKCNLNDILKASFYLLKNRGRANFVYRPDRFVDIITESRANRLEPKRLQFVHPGLNKNANLMLLELMKNGQPELTILNPKILQG